MSGGAKHFLKSLGLDRSADPGRMPGEDEHLLGVFLKCPERHMPGHKTGGLSEAESFSKVRTGEVYDSRQGDSHCLGVSPEYT